MKKQTLKVNDVDFSSFDLSHIHRTSFDIGQLVPLACMQTLPRDQFEIQVSNFIRAMPTKFPMLDGLDLKFNHFYVPYRVLWNGFEQFISLAKNTRIPTNQIPTVLLNSNEGVNNNYQNGRLADYLGLGKLDIASGDNREVSAMPFLAYQKIYLDHYAPKRWVNYDNPDGSTHPLQTLRGQLETIQYGGTQVVDNISATSPLGTLRRVNWNHDYFTNALPTPTLFEDQKLPLFTSTLDELNYNESSGEFYISEDGTAVPFNDGSPIGQGNSAMLSTIRDLRKSISLQHYLEKLQQAGGGYMETMKVQWNKDLPNDLLQRSEYLGTKPQIAWSL